jgi:hypothetical protein
MCRVEPRVRGNGHLRLSCIPAALSLRGKDICVPGAAALPSERSRWAESSAQKRTPCVPGVTFALCGRGDGGPARSPLVRVHRSRTWATRTRLYLWLDVVRIERAEKDIYVPSCAVDVCDSAK